MTRAKLDLTNADDSQKLLKIIKETPEKVIGAYVEVSKRRYGSNMELNVSTTVIGISHPCNENGERADCARTIFLLAAPVGKEAFLPGTGKPWELKVTSIVLTV